MAYRTAKGRTLEPIILQLEAAIARQSWDYVDAGLEYFWSAYSAANAGTLTPQESAEVNNAASRAQLVTSWLREHQANDLMTGFTLPWNTGNKSAEAERLTKLAQEAARMAQVFAAQSQAAKATMSAQSALLQKQGAIQQREAYTQGRTLTAEIGQAAWYNQDLFGVPTWAWIAGGAVTLVYLAKR